MTSFHSPHGIQHTVPAPTIAVSMDPPSATLYVGTYTDLTCTVTISESVDTPVTVTFQWERLGFLISNDSDYTITYTAQWFSTLRISQLNIERDNGSEYYCIATVASSNPYIQQSNGSAKLSLEVEGKTDYTKP